MVNVVVSGLPRNVKLPKFLVYLERTFFGTLHVKLLNTVFNPDATKTFTFSMRSNDARKARRSLDGYVYKYAGQDYLLQCWTEDEFGQEQVRYDNQFTLSPEIAYTEYEELNDYEEPEALCEEPEVLHEYDKPESKSVTLLDELQEVELKILLLQKQRILAEEENKLQQERKKTHMLKKIGPNDFQKLAHYESAYGGKGLPEYRRLQLTAPQAPPKRTKIPNVASSCYRIIAEMQNVINENVDVDIHHLIKPAVKKRLVALLEGKPPTKTQDILHLYREKYPQDTDKILVKELMEKINQIFEIKKDDPNNSNKDNETENKNTDVEVEETQLKQQTAEISSNEIELTQGEDLNLLEDVDRDYEDWLAEPKAEKTGNSFQKLGHNEKACGLPEVRESQFPASQAKYKRINIPNLNESYSRTISEMQNVIHENVDVNIRHIIMPAINTAVKKRLIALHEGKPPMTTQVVLHLYRENYPHNTDKKLLEELIENVSKSFGLKKDESNKANKDNETGNKDTDVDVNEPQPKEDVRGPTTTELNSNEIDLTPSEGLNQLDTMDSDYEDWLAEPKDEESVEVKVEEQKS